MDRLGTPLAGGRTPEGSSGPPPRTSVLLAAKAGRPGTAAGGAAARPLTSSKGAGYSSTAAAPGSPSAAAARASVAAAPPGAPPSREQCEALEARVHAALEAAAERAAVGDAPGAVDAAKEAARREQRLCGLLEAGGAGDQISLDLKFAASLGLAAAYESNGQLSDALHVYTQVIRSRLFPQVPLCGCRWWVRVHSQSGGGSSKGVGVVSGGRQSVPGADSPAGRPLLSRNLALGPLYPLHAGRLAAPQHGRHPLQAAGLRAGVWVCGCGVCVCCGVGGGGGSLLLR